MDAYDKGSDARHGPAGRGGGPDPRPVLPGPASPVDSPPPGQAPPADAQAPPHSPGAGNATGSPAGTHTGTRTGTHAVGDLARTGVAALSPRHQIAAAVALAVVAAVVCVHLGMTFLHVAPQNTVSTQHRETIEGWIYPEFEQNWKLFAPNPLQQNVAVEVRAEIRTAEGSSRTTGWYDLSAQDGRAIDGNPLPSHTQQNELRRAWDFFVSTHDSENRPVGLRGALSEAYLRRIMVLRLDRAEAAGPGGVLDRVQVRSRTTNVPPPDWSGEKISTTPVYRTLPWWSLPEDETRGGIG